MFRNPLLRLFFAQRFLFSLGFQMRTVAIGWQVYELTKRPLDLGFVGLAQFLPALAFSLVSGQIADRYDRKKITLITQFLDALCSVGLCALAAGGNSSVIPIYALLILLGIGRAFSAAATQSLLPSLVEEGNLARAIAWNSSIWQIAVVSGPAIGGLVYGWTQSAAFVYGLCAGCAAAAIVLTSGLRPRQELLEKGAVTWDTLLAGIRYVWNKKMILGSISMDLFAVLLGGAVALLPVYASDILNVGPMGLGLLRSAPGIGAAVMGALLAFFPLKKNVGRKMYTCVFIFGLGTIIFGVSTNFTLSLICLTVMGAADLVSVVIRLTLVQILTPPNMRGRVSAVNSVFIGASNELGEFESGVTAAWWGIVPAVVVGGIGTCVVVVLWAFLFPGLLAMDKLDGSKPKGIKSTFDT